MARTVNFVNKQGAKRLISVSMYHVGTYNENLNDISVLIFLKRYSFCKKLFLT